MFGRRFNCKQRKSPRLPQIAESKQKISQVHYSTESERCQMVDLIGGIVTLVFALAVAIIVARADKRSKRYKKHIENARSKMHREITFAECLLPIEEVAE